ncbi:ImuA family protein [Asticcacaulis sp. AND118]|uniref:ImuA family protein n=1 Tax=Asticcacaulis sp. AND118 TaxID=2840468 RepID=UPI001CFF5B3F|nr:damage-inducible protein [Asticcacaulis sp. AND118]UDF03031.1 damage-inducible protein [Asticcacaulis sp. AND118]
MTLRQRIQALDGSQSPVGALPFSVSEIDRRLPGGGLAMGALHEVTGDARGAVDGAAAALFAAGVAARTTGQVLWCITRNDLFAPGLAQAGLTPDRLIYVEAGDEKSVLACCEEALRHRGLGAVVGEVSRLSLTASRRLQLAAEGRPVLSLIVRRWGREQDAVAFGQPTAAVTRWRVGPLPSVPLPVPGLGRARWRLELLRCKGGDPAVFDVEACDAEGRLALAAPVVHRPLEAADRADHGHVRIAS